jgi:hypothetical protein
MNRLSLAPQSHPMTKIVIAGLDNIAAELGCSKKTLYKWIREKDFPAFKMDGVWRAMPRDIVIWLDGQKRGSISSACFKGLDKAGGSDAAAHYRQGTLL